MKSLLSLLRDSLSRHKLTRDIAWSMGSFFILAISGIVINIVVTAVRDAAALGVFNLAYAVYIVVSQFAVWGIHYSVLRYSAFYAQDLEQRSRMLVTAGAMSLVLGAFFATAIYLAEPLLSAAFDSQQTGRAIQYAAFGLVVFPLNKVLLAYLNGLREMKAFSILQGLRYSTVMVVVSVVAVSDLDNAVMTLGFLVAEMLTASLALWLIARSHLARLGTVSLSWVKRHFVFGSKGLLGGMFAEVNSRIDVLLIGFFLDERSTGIYSFAAMLVDGLYHVLAMIRINFNPLLVAAVRDQNWAQAGELRRQSSRFVRPVVIALSALLVVSYAVLSLWVVPGKGLMEGFWSLLVLLLGLNIIAVLVPFDNLMVVSGHPGYQAAQQVSTVTVNALVAVAFIPWFGIEGAALGTATSYLAGMTLLYLFTRRLLGWDLLRNETPLSRSTGLD